MFANYMEQQRRGNQEVSARFNGYSKDLLVDKFSDTYSFLHNKIREEAAAAEEDGGLELSLGLSLNGRFGVDPEKGRINLARSSSVQAFSLFGGDNRHNAPPQAVPIAAGYAPPLSRTCSLPTEAEAESWKKRKEMQSLRRLEAKRRRMDKIKILRSSAERKKADSEDNSSEETGSNSNSTTGSCAVCDGHNGNGAPPWSLKSVGSQGSCSSGLSELETQPVKGTDRDIESRNSPKMQPAVTPGLKVDKGLVADNEVATTDEAKKMLKNFMLQMPCVMTVGSGPNGRRVDGFLYRYGKGEEVQIVCVCHGSFLSPAEFIKHAGGAEVENPLRHIVINPSPVL